jgi:hypothetical protein
MTIIEIELRRYLIPSEREALDIVLADVPDDRRDARLASMVSQAMRADFRVANMFKGKV